MRAVCRIIACILHNVQLTKVLLDPEPHPSVCVGHDAWRSEGLPVPPSKVVAQGWTEVLNFLRVRSVFARNFKPLRAQLTTCPRCARSSTATA
jgi:hypothetical protein